MKEELEIEKENKKFGIFLNLSKIFKKKSTQILELDHKDKITKELSIKFDQFEVMGNDDMLFQMIKNGYIVNKKQNQIIQDKISNWLKSVNAYKVEQYLELGFTLTDEDMDDYFKNLLMKKNHYHIDFDMDFFMVSNDLIKASDNHGVLSLYGKKRLTQKNFSPDEKIYDLPLLTNKLKTYIRNSNINYCKNLFDNLSKYALLIKKDTGNSIGSHYYDTLRNDQSPLDKLISILESDNNDWFLKDVSFDEFFNLTYELKKENRRTHYLNVLQNTLDTYYKDGLNQIILKTRTEYADEYLKNITVEKITENANISTVSTLPKTAKDIVSEINNLYEKIEESKESISIDKKFILKTLFDIRVPEVLKKYLVLDEEFRTTFKNAENQNAEEVMIQSLNDFKTKFEEIWIEINEQRFSSLNVTGKYAKSIKTI